MYQNIVLIGPSPVRSLVAQMLSLRLNIPLRSSVHLQTEDLKAVGYDSSVQPLEYDKSPLAYYRYLMPFHLQLLKKLLAAPDNFIFDFEPKYTVYEEPSLLIQAHKALQPFPNVVFLTPSSDPDDTARLIRQRKESWYGGWNEINDLLVDHQANYQLAKLTHYTQGLTPPQSCVQIIASLRRNKSGNVILIGPVNSGKSTLGRLLVQTLGRDQVSLDNLRDKYYSQIGFDQLLAKNIRATGTAWELFNYTQPFHPYGVEQVLAEYSESVIDFGAGHTVYTDETLFKRVEKALTPYPNVVLIIPCADKTKAKWLLRERSNQLFSKMNELDEHLAGHPSGRTLAKFEVYTEGKSPEQICEEVLTRVRLSPG
jgi:adenylate kinase family enzyme